MNFTRISWFVTIALLLCTGCKSTKVDDDGALASVAVRGSTPAEIIDSVEEVFARHGYKTMHAGPTSMVLEKKGSLGTEMAYGNWLGSHVIIRVRTRIVPLEDGSGFRLQCKADRVRDAGQLLEETIPIKYGSGTFKKLLNEVVSELKANPAVNTGTLSN